MLSEPIVLAGAGALAAVLAGGAIAWYGASQYDAGYAARNVEALQQEAVRTVLAAQAAKEEQERANAAAEKYEELQNQTDSIAADLRGARERLRQYADAARPNRPASPSATPGPDATGPDWIGVFAACVSEYELLGVDAARVADQLRALQGAVTP